MRTAVLLVLAVLVFAAPAAAQVEAKPALLDRVVVRWHAPETGGVTRPQFVYERELAFEARLQALTDPDPDPGPFTDRHVRTALDQHIAETLLASLPILPAPEAAEIASRAEYARGVVEQRVKGRDKLLAAAKAEGISWDELDALLRRHARASLYLDRMVSPMLAPSDPELRALLRTGTTPFTGHPYEEVSGALARWLVARRLNEATSNYYQTARSRVTVTIVRAR